MTHKESSHPERSEGSAQKASSADPSSACGLLRMTANGEAKETHTRNARHPERSEGSAKKASPADPSSASGLLRMTANGEAKGTHTHRPPQDDIRFFILSVKKSYTSI